jgi:hypothetical protein
MLPIENVLPEADEQLTASAPSTKSLADASKLTAAPSGPVPSKVTSGGSVNCGAVVS